MKERLFWQIGCDQDPTEVALVGDITEEANLTLLLEQLKGRKRIRFNLEKIERINSCGVREWINFIRPLSTESEVDLSRCSSVIVNQLNVFKDFAGSAKVSSILVPYVCNGCNFEVSSLYLTVPGQQPQIAPVKCPECGEDMEFDDVPEEYFAFLK